MKIGFFCAFLALAAANLVILAMIYGKIKAKLAILAELYNKINTYTYDNGLFLEKISAYLAEINQKLEK